MSKAFTKEGEVDVPAFVPPRAPLPAGVANYVTARGLELLRDELRQLAAERARLDAAPGSADRLQALSLLSQRKSDLEQRVASATLVDVTHQPRDEVRFGASVTVRTETGDERRYQIVGVDEADASAGRIAFVSPLARALLGRCVGESSILKTPKGNEELEVLAIEYESAVPL